jgi:hypothetical protein
MKQWDIEVTSKIGEIYRETVAAATFKGACGKAEKIAKTKKSKVTSISIVI